MPVTTDQPAPYAPTSAIMDLIERHRNKGLPAIVDADVLQRAGISTSLVPRTLQALKTLDLLDNEGRPSQVFENIRLAPTADYERSLTEWLNAAYADALSYVDPATDDEVAFRDAFRKYTPTGQQSRMVSLFMGLFTAAGVMPLRQKQSTPRASGNGTPAKPAKVKSAQRQTIQTTAETGASTQIHAHRYAGAGQLPPAIAGLIATLPIETGIWTQDRRDKFVATFEAVLDYTFAIGELPAPQTDTGTDQH